MTTSSQSEKIYYLAGFFDGEGCITCRKHQRTIAIKISNTNPHLLQLFKDKFGGNIYRREADKKAHQVKVWYLWEMSKKKNVLDFLEEITPHLIEKKPQAELALEFMRKYCDIRITYEANDEYRVLFDRMKELKKVEYLEIPVA